MKEKETQRGVEYQLWGKDAMIKNQRVPAIKYNIIPDCNSQLPICVRTMVR